VRLQRRLYQGGTGRPIQYPRRYRFPSIEPPLQNYKLDLDLTQRVDLWSGKDTQAPDIAFLKIPEFDATNLQAKGSVFYNLLGRAISSSATQIITWPRLMQSSA
jgi:hypothetical protein